MSQAKLEVTADRRSGHVSAAMEGRGDPVEEGYNITRGENEYAPIKRELRGRSGSGDALMTAQITTASEYVGRTNYECTGLKLSSRGVIGLPRDPAAQGTGIVEDSIDMGFRVASLRQGESLSLELKAFIESDMDVVEIRLMGPAFAKPVVVFETSEQILTIDKPGIYGLRGAYRLAVRTPNSGLGGRDLIIEMRAELTMVS